MLPPPTRTIHTAFKTLEEMPVHPRGADEIPIDPQFEDGLCDLDGFSHIYLIIQLHKMTKHSSAMTATEQDVKVKRSDGRFYAPPSGKK